MEPVVYLTPMCGLKGQLILKPLVSTEEGSDVYNFLGVPYAEPPVGSLRFCDPKPVALWSGIRSATKFGPVCPQDFSVLNVLPFTMPQPEQVSEDCLYLNIWTPSLSNDIRLPVMVWIHGGALLAGLRIGYELMRFVIIRLKTSETLMYRGIISSFKIRCQLFEVAARPEEWENFTCELDQGFSDQYDLKALACFHNVVVVSINYRLASFGFMSLNDESAAGNYGILDQIEALKWIQRYISRFDGDPENVIIFGESAGSMSVSLLITSPLAKGLFRRAIAQSGTVFSGDFGCRTMQNAFARTYDHMAKTLAGCPPPTASGSEIVEFLRRQSPEDLVTTFTGFQFTPVIDGRVFPESTTERYERGEFNDCDLIVGCNTDEGEMVHEFFVKKILLPGEVLNRESARAALLYIISIVWSIPDGKPVYKAIVDQYIDESFDYTYDDLRRIMAECFGDLMFVFPTIRAALCHSRKCKTYVYQFCHRPPDTKGPDYARALHGCELFYTLRLLGFFITFKKEDVELARQVSTYWTNFARTGNPNGLDLEEWPEYDETTKRHLAIEIPPRCDKNMKSDRADFWLHQLPKILSDFESTHRTKS